ncbi:MAG: hypothetical protein OEX22_07220 [Cyclobacteriaceae bacterium]|nr:hypothetical protein [Cyclobacteriaceae bacterium]
MKNKQEKDQNIKFTKEYCEIMEIDNNSVFMDNQWKNEGDYIQKFSLYENYTPVKTSGSTTLISEI